MIRKVNLIYYKYNKLIEKFIFPIFLFLYPLVKVNQGIDVSDSTYSLGNYLYYANMKGMWVISTFLSNVAGSFLVHLPGGHTLLGMNIYTGIIVSFLALICYYAFKRFLKAPIMFAGEIIAIGFCWIPTVILYNYLSYLFFDIGAILLYFGMIQDMYKKLFWAGIVLGMNVMVRFPNLTEASLIIVLWYACYIKNDKFNIIKKKTLYCISGYILGFTVPFVLVLCRYGFSSFLEMLSSLATIKEVDESYSSLSMITSVLSAYARSFKWFFFIIAGIILGMMMFSVMRGKLIHLKKIIYLIGIAILLRFFWGRGMFTFRYYEDYTSMFEWGMLVLYLSIISAVLVLIKKQYDAEIKIMAVMVLIIVFITPLGSNNYTCQNLNNLFLVMPFTLFIVCNWLKESFTKEFQFRLWGDKFPLQAMLIVILIFVVIQTIGFHFTFVFRDGMRGEKRDTIMMGTKTVDHMMTNDKNANEIGNLISFCTDHSLIGEEAIFFGDAPGLSYLLRMPFAISTSWPDLDSYALSEFTKELRQLNRNPIIIMKKSQPATIYAAKKQDVLKQYMEENKYKLKYENSGYSVFSVD